MKNLAKGDKIVAALVALVAVLSYIIFTFFVLKGHPDGVEVFVDGKLYATYSLTEFEKPKKIEVVTEYGKNVLQMDCDGVSIIDASCPDKRDVKAGKITKAGQTIICVPNRVLVKLTGKSDSNVDKVAY